MNYEISQFQLQTEWFSLRAAIEALVSGDAQLVKDDEGFVTEIRWDEPDCGIGDRLVGIVRCEDVGGWVPLIEVGSEN